MSYKRQQHQQLRGDWKKRVTINRGTDLTTAMMMMMMIERECVRACEDRRMARLAKICS